MRTPHRLLQLPIFLVVALVLACGEDTLEIPVALTCADLIIVDVEGGQRSPYVVPVGGSLVIRVGLRELTRDYEFCSEISLQRFRWEIDDPSLARVENSVERGRPLRHGDPTSHPSQRSQDWRSDKHGSLCFMIWTGRSCCDSKSWNRKGAGADETARPPASSNPASLWRRRSAAPGG